MARGLKGSSSTPVLPNASRRGGPPSAGSSSAMQPPSNPGATIVRLERENEELRFEINKERSHFSKAFIKDFKSPARRRIEPMRRLVADQSECASILVTEAMEKLSLIHI